MNKRSQEKTSSKKKKAAIASALLSKKKKRNAAKVVNVKLSARGAKAQDKKQAGKSRSSVKLSKKAKSEKAKKKSPEKVKDLTLRSAVSTAAAEQTPTAFITPTKALLRPFREAAQRNRKLAAEAAKKKRNVRAFIKKPEKSGKKITADLRIHSPATRGYFSVGGVEPGLALVRLALAKNLNIIGLTDYYSADFVDIVREASREAAITVLPGFDLKCCVGGCDDVTLTTLFPEHLTQADIERILAELGVPTQAKGDREYSLQTSIDVVIEIVEARGGLIIPTRLDKTPYRQLAIPELVERFGFHAFDLVHPENPEFFRRNWPQGEFTFFSFSNANALGQVGSRSMTLRMAEDGFAGLRALISRRDPSFLFEQ